jgi:hypothetical protein
MRVVLSRVRTPAPGAPISCSMEIAEKWKVFLQMAFGRRPIEDSAFPGADKRTRGTHFRA